jgi:hypothetical protein
VSASTTWTCDRCRARVEIQDLGAPAPAPWIPVASFIATSALGGSREMRASEAHVACSPACAEALAHDLVTAAFAAGNVSSLDLSRTLQPPERS